MTAPRQVLRGATYFVTRRCSQRQLLLRPDPVVNQTFEYALAVAAALHGVRLHAYCVMSNHYHLILTDPRAELPAFMQRLDGVLARALNAHRSRREHFWGPDSYHALMLWTPADLIHWASYALANPVAAGLVRRARRWPGCWSRPIDVGGRKAVARPARFFDQTRTEGRVVELRLEVPPGFDSAAGFRAELLSALKARERDAVESGKRFLGPRRVVEQSPFSFPAASEPFRAAIPKVACRDPALRRELLCRLEAFQGAYREALDEWRRKIRSVHFPEGTYLMRVAHGVACAGAG